MRYNEEVMTAAAARDAAAAKIRRDPNVHGTGIGFRRRKGQIVDEICVRIYVEKKLPPRSLSAKQRLPKELVGPNGDKVPVDVEEVPRFVRTADNTSYWPVLGGCSIGQYGKKSAGTLGGIVWDLTDNQLVALTAGHVLTDNPKNPPSEKRVIQPAGDFLGTESANIDAYVLGERKRLISFDTSLTKATAPQVKAEGAIFTIVNRPSASMVIDIGPAVYETYDPWYNLLVKKRGRESLLTHANITDIMVYLDVDVGNGAPERWAQLYGFRMEARVWDNEEQDWVVGGIAADEGDSGSIVFLMDDGPNGPQAVGLTVAGTPMKVYAHNCYLDEVFSRLQITDIRTGFLLFIINLIIKALKWWRKNQESRQAELKLFFERIERTPNGKALLRAVHADLMPLSQTLVEDRDAQRYFIKAIEPWLRAESNEQRFSMAIDEVMLQALQPVHAGALRRRTKPSDASDWFRLLTQMKGLPLKRVLGLE